MNQEKQYYHQLQNVRNYKNVLVIYRLICNNSSNRKNSSSSSNSSHKLLGVGQNFMVVTVVTEETILTEITAITKFPESDRMSRVLVMYGLSCSIHCSSSSNSSHKMSGVGGKCQ